MTPLNSGAMFEVSGTIPTNATWSEDIYFTQDAEPLDISGLDWKLTLRCSDSDTAAEYTLSTDAGSLIIADDEDGYHRILRISLAAGILNNLDGDYVADLASRDVNGQVDLWAHGIVTLRANPVSF